MPSCCAPTACGPTSADEVIGKVLNEFPVRQAAEIFINTARDRGKGRGDNISLAIVRIKEVEAPKKPNRQWKKAIAGA